MIEIHSAAHPAVCWRRTEVCYAGEPVVEGQIVDGVAHGIGNAFLERLVYDEGAQPLTTNLGEYLLPLAGYSMNLRPTRGNG